MRASEITSRIAHVQERIANAALRAGRDPNSITLVAVTKERTLDEIIAAYEAGIRHFGENRVEEALEKIPYLDFPDDDPPTWHMIGHLQSRKARTAIDLFDIIHSVDRLKIAQRLSRFAREADLTIPILLEINVSGEESKYGFHLSKRGWIDEPLFAQLVSIPNLEIQGLMTVAPIAENPEEVRPVFAKLRELRDRLQERFPQVNWHHLSMGMSDDFEVAVEEGATIVRIGRAIFGPRR